MKNSTSSKGRRASAPVPCSAALDAQIRKAVEADIRQYLTDALSPQRGYATPIDNVKALILALMPQN